MTPFVFSRVICRAHGLDRQPQAIRDFRPRQRQLKMDATPVHRMRKSHIRHAFGNHEQEACDALLRLLAREQEHPFLAGVEFGQRELEKPVLQSGMIRQQFLEAGRRNTQSSTSVAASAK